MQARIPWRISSIGSETAEPELATQFSWKDLGDSHESLKPMTFWMKPLP